MRLRRQMHHNVGAHSAHQLAHGCRIFEIGGNAVDRAAHCLKLNLGFARHAEQLPSRGGKQMLGEVAADKSVDARKECTHGRV